jgi:hypothetical protein
MSGYGDPAQERLGNGRTMAELMRGGARGIRGVIVAKSTPGGVPVNFNPHDRQKIEIHIEPDGPNSQAVTLDQMTSDRVDQAIRLATEQYPGGDIDSIRERTAMAFEELAKQAKSNVQRVPTKQTAVRPSPPPVPPRAAELLEEATMLEALQEESRELAGYSPGPNLPATPPLEKIDRGYSPMAAFGLKRPAAQQPPVGGSSGSSKSVGAPQKLLYFEKEGIGTVPAFFHDVLVSVSRQDPDNPEQSGFLVLVYDLRFEQNAARWFPPANDPYQRPWAVQINEDRRLYLVHTTGFQYVYDNREYCVLMVERAVVAAQEEG